MDKPDKQVTEKDVSVLDCVEQILPNKSSGS